MADLKISVDIDASGTAAGAAQAKAAIKGIGDEAERTQRRASSILDIDFRAAAAKLQSVGEMVGNAGQRMQQAGQSMSVAVTRRWAAAVITASLYLTGVVGRSPKNFYGRHFRDSTGNRDR